MTEIPEHFWLVRGGFSRVNPKLPNSALALSCSHHRHSAAHSIAITSAAMETPIRIHVPDPNLTAPKCLSPELPNRMPKRMVAKRPFTA